MAEPQRITPLRGFIRIWIVGTIVWIAGVVIYAYVYPDPHFFYLGTAAAEGQTMTDGVVMLVGTALLPPLAILIVALIVAWIGRGFVSAPRPDRRRR